MALTYSDYGNPTFARIKGDKAEASCKLIFEEIKVYKHENSYVLAGQFSLFSGVDRNYGNDPINPGLCEIALYGSEYEDKRKNQDTKKWESIKLQPSIAEKILYDHIENNPAIYLQEGKALSGEIVFSANYMIKTVEGDSQITSVLNGFKVEAITPSGKYPDWTPPKAYSNGNNNGYGSKAISPTEKISLLKKELASSIMDSSFKESAETMPLGALVHKVIEENKGHDIFLSVYSGLLNSIFR